MKTKKSLILIGGASSNQLPIQAIGFETLVEAFFRDKDPETVRAYNRRLANFAAFLKVETLPQMAATFLSKGQGQANLLALNFKDHLIKEKFSASTVAGHLTALHSLVKLGRMLDLVPWTLGVSADHVEAYRDTQGPGTEAIAKVLDSLEEKTDPMSVRNRTIITLLYECCLRRGDLISLDLEHVDFAGHQIWPKRKKRTDRTSFPLHAGGEASLKAWIAVRGDKAGPLFTNFDPAKKGSGRLTGMSIVRICHKYGLGRPHGLRHTGTTDALEITNGNIPEVMKLTGHKDPKTLMIYNDNRENKSADLSQKLSEFRKRKK